MTKTTWVVFLVESHSGKDERSWVQAISQNSSSEMAYPNWCPYFFSLPFPPLNGWIIPFLKFPNKRSNLILYEQSFVIVHDLRQYSQLWIFRLDLTDSVIRSFFKLQHNQDTLFISDYSALPFPVSKHLSASLEAPSNVVTDNLVFDRLHWTCMNRIS